MAIVGIKKAGVGQALDLESRQRIAEIGEILAAGLVRLRARQSSQIPADCGEGSLDCVGHQSGHANPETENGG